MGSIASLGAAVSGLKASQIGINVTSHNLTNIHTKGYTRQQLLQHDSSYLTVGMNSTNLNQVGLGVSLTEIRQIRDEFIDTRIRTETSVLNFYQTQENTVSEIEAILDEPYGQTLSGNMEDFWKQAQKLATNPGGVEERLSFIQTADVLIKRANQIFEGLEDYQYHLNDQINITVNRINQITEEIDYYNDLISESEMNGDNANDYRDARNLLLDELSEYIAIDYEELPSGRVNVSTNGRALVDMQFVSKIEMELLDNGTGFSVPVWGDTGELVFNMKKEANSLTGEDNGKLLGLLMSRGEEVGGVTTSWDDIAINDNKSVDIEGNSYIIPRTQKQIAELMQGITEMVNSVLSGDGLDGADGLMVFVPTGSYGDVQISDEGLEALRETPAHVLNSIMDGLGAPMIGKRTDSAGNEIIDVGLNEYISMHRKYTEMVEAYSDYLEDPAAKAAYEQALAEYETSKAAYETAIEGIPAEDLVEMDPPDESKEIQEMRAELKILFSAENIEVNPKLLESGGYNYLGTVSGGSENVGDNALVTKLIDEWSQPREWNTGDGVTSPRYKQADFMDYYAELVSDLGVEGFGYGGKVDEKTTMVLNNTNEKLSMSSVSQDEELSTLLKYQYAYNASSRMINVLDGMMDTIINKM